MLLKDKVAVITGGAGPNGLGFATAKLMAQHGARVAVLDLARAEPATAAAKLGDGHLGVVADVTDKASCDAADRRRAQGLRPHRRAGQQRRHHAAAQDGGHHQRRLRRDPRREPARHAADVAGRDPADAAPEAAARSSASRRCRRSAAAASSAARTTRPPRPACSAWRARWRASCGTDSIRVNCDHPGADPDRHPEGQAQRRAQGRDRETRSRSAASARPTTSPAPACISPATCPATAPASRST